MKESVELARLCSLDIGREVHSEDVRRYLMFGETILWQRGYTQEERAEIRATLLKELAE